MGTLVASVWSRCLMAREHDLNHRLNDLARAVETCARKIATQNYEADGLIRGIFVAPEYYLSRTRAGFKLADGSRSPRQILSEEKDNVVARLKELSRRWPRILILPGTVAWERPKDLEKIQRRLGYYERRREQAVGSEMRSFVRKNFGVSIESGLFVMDDDMQAYLRSNGRPMPVRPLSDQDVESLIKDLDPAYLKVLETYVTRGLPSLSFLNSGSEMVDAAKMRASRMMFNTAYGMLNGQLVLKYHKQANYNEEAGQDDLVFVPGGKSGIFSMEGMRIGLEICLDHGVGSMRVQARASRPIDVHIIQSDYVEFKPGNAMMKTGGYLLHSSTHPQHNYVWRMGPGGWTHAPSVGVDACSGNPVTHYELEVDTGGAFDLSNSFMADLPGRDPQKWAKVQAPGKTFRSRG